MTPDDQNFWKWVGAGGTGFLGFCAWVLPKLYRTFLADRRATDQQEFEHQTKQSEQVFEQGQRMIDQCVGRMDRMDARISELQTKQADCEARHAAEVHLHNRCKESRKILRVKMRLVEMGIGPRNPNYLKEYERLLVDMEHHPDDVRPHEQPARPNIDGSNQKRLKILPPASPQHFD